MGQSKIKNEFDRPVFAIAEGVHTAVSEKADFRERTGVGKFIVNVGGACKIVLPDEIWMKLFDVK